MIRGFEEAGSSRLTGSSALQGTLLALGIRALSPGQGPRCSRCCPNFGWHPPSPSKTLCESREDRAPPHHEAHRPLCSCRGFLRGRRLFHNAIDVKYEDRNCQRLLIWILPISLFQLLIFHKDEFQLPALSDRHYLGVLLAPGVEIYVLLSVRSH